MYRLLHILFAGPSDLNFHVVFRGNGKGDIRPVGAWDVLFCLPIGRGGF